MSRFGARPIKIQEGVEIKTAGFKVVVAANGSQLEMEIPQVLELKVLDDNIYLNRKEESNEAKALHGLTWRLLRNMIIGVKEHFKRELEFSGTGYRVAVTGNEIILNMGYSHEVRLPISEGLKVTTVKNNITIEGIEKDKVGEFAAKVRAVRPPEVYKGKGIKYKDEFIKRKAGKSATSK